MRQAASVPKGTASNTASNAVPKAKDRVGPTRSAIRADTGLFR